MGDAQQSIGGELGLNRSLQLGIGLGIDVAGSFVLGTSMRESAHVKCNREGVHTRTMILLFLINARASAMSCFSPAL